MATAATDPTPCPLDASPHPLNLSPRPLDAAPRLLDVDDVALALTVDPRYVRRLIADGRLPSVKVGKFVRVDVDDLAAFVDAGRREVGDVA